MEFSLRKSSALAAVLLYLCAVASPLLRAQSSFTSQLTGVITDSSGAVIPGAKVTLTDEATSISTTVTTNGNGVYVLTNLRPATYAIRAEAPNLAPQERKGLVLAVSQQATLDFTLSPSSVSASVTVTEQAPLLDTGSASLGTDVTNEYVRDIPLINRSMFGLVFLAGGVTESAGSGTQDSYPSGTNFISNGQRNSTAEIRVDGALTSAPEQGEGATSNVYYQPSVEIVQEFKVENNSFSAEYGNNGGTVVNFVLKEGGNKFHGSGWWFGQRAALDANDFFNNAAGIARPDHLRDQYGFSLGGPIHKGKTFFFLDFERQRQNDPVNFSGTVPTDLQRKGDFSQTFNPDGSLQQIYNPRNCVVPVTGPPCVRSTIAGNDLTTLTPDPIGLALLKLYPEPTPGLGDLVTGFNNYRAATVSSNTQNQIDIKLDHHFNDKRSISGRYSYWHSNSATPFVVGSGSFNDGMSSFTKGSNLGLEYNWALKSTVLWTNRFALDRVNSPVKPILPSLSSVNFPAILAQANGITRMPSIQVDNGNGTNNWLNMYTQCCVNTNFAHTLYSYSSALSQVHGRHTIKTGFEQRQFFNNFWQPDNPTGFFNFTQSTTNQFAGGTDPTQGNPFASLYLGYGDSGSFINIKPSVADKSLETGFYVQDDWKISSRLTINLGLRYEWSTPYTERFNHQQFSDFTGDTGISVVLPLSNGQPIDLKGTTLFPGQGGVGRSVPVDRNNLAPRLGFAFSLDSKTVVRGGAGIYYGMSPATNYQYAGSAFNGSVPVLFTLDSGVTQSATLGNPFPQGLPLPQKTKYGKLAMWGYGDPNNVGTEEARNAEIYQWNLGVQRLFPGQFVIGVDYSANHSTHLPYSSNSGSRNRNFISSTLLARIVADPTIVGCPPGPNDPQNLNISACLGGLVNNPFLPFFQGPNAIFNEPAAPQYNNAQIPLLNLLRPFPQFDGTFEGLPNFGAESFYNSLQIRFQKRPSHYISFEGNYTLSKATDNSSAGANSFVGGLGLGIPQQLDRLNLEHAVSANDATHRMVLAAILDAPIGRNRWIGHDMNRFLDAIVGGWSISPFLTFQSGQPLALTLSNGALADGNQRPNVLCPQVSSGISYHAAASTGASIFNAACFAAPPQQVPGNAPRYFSNLRSDGIHNVDISFSKEFAIREGMKLQLRGEFFNFMNTPRFGYPDLAADSGTFGQVTTTASGSTPRHTQFGIRFEF
jgi:hypothetical protein